MRVALPERVRATALIGLDPARPVQALAGVGLGTGWRVRCHAPREIALDTLRTAIERRLEAIVAEMSQWEPASTLSVFNRAAAGSWITLPPDFAAVLAAALTVAEQSGGMFDPTLGRIAARLGFGAEPAAAVPTAAELDAMHAEAGWRRLAFDPATRRLRQPGGLWLDLSGIAKGFAVDAVAALLREQGIEHALVEIGGELAGRGLRPDGQPWWVDLEQPPGFALPRLRIGLHEAAIATSGDTVRAHTLDPRSGRPLDDGVAAVSVVHDGAMLADAWATALFVAGPEEGMAIATRHDVAARWLLRGGGPAERLSPAMERLLA